MFYAWGTFTTEFLMYGTHSQDNVLYMGDFYKIMFYTWGTWTTHILYMGNFDKIMFHTWGL